MKNNNLYSFWLSLCLFCPSILAEAQIDSEPTTYPAAQIINTHQRHLYSRINKKEYQIYISLPDSYSQSDSLYPGLYLTDANTYFGMMTDMTRNLQWGREMPEMLTIGIAYPLDSFDTDDERWEKWLAWRMQDFTPTNTAQIDKDFGIEGIKSGEADKFIQFIEQELIPFIESNYRVKSSDRTYAGFSLGGSFGLYTLFKKPELFQRYLIGSPSIWYDDKVLMKYENSYAQTHDDLAAKLFIAVGELEEEVNAGMVRNMLELTSKMKSRNYESLSLSWAILDNETHMSAPSVCFQRGLRYFFRN